MAHIFFADMETNTTIEFYDDDTVNGTIAASNEQAKTGTYSLKANITVAGGHARSRSFFSSATLAEMYFRFYYYLPTATYNNINVAGDYITLVIGLTAAHGTVWRLRIWNNAGTVQLRYTNGVSDEDIACPSRDTWHCIEIYHKRDAAAGAWQWWLDGASQGSNAGINTGAANVRYARWGAALSAGMTGAIYLDNIVVSNDRIYELMGNIPQGNALRNRKESPQGWII